MTAHRWVLVAHVLVAVVGISQAVGVALVAGAARRGGLSVAAAARPLRALLFVASVSVPLLFLTGGLLDHLTGGGYRAEIWFRLAAATMAAVGVMTVLSRRTLRGSLAHGGAGAAPLRRIERLAWAKCAGIAFITVLMEAKPTG